MTHTEDLPRKVRAHRDLPPPILRRAIRQAAGLTQQDLADPCEVDRATVSRWESGARRPRGPDLVRYSELLRSLREDI